MNHYYGNKKWKHKGTFNTELFRNGNEILDQNDQVVLLPDFVYRAMDGHDYGELSIGIIENGSQEATTHEYPGSWDYERVPSGEASLTFLDEEGKPVHKFSPQETEVLFYDFFNDDIEDIDVLEDTGYPDDIYPEDR